MRLAIAVRDGGFPKNHAAAVPVHALLLAIRDTRKHQANAAAQTRRHAGQDASRIVISRKQPRQPRPGGGRRQKTKKETP
jgi:hypothetical protein